MYCKWPIQFLIHYHTKKFDLVIVLCRFIFIVNSSFRKGLRIPWYLNRIKWVLGTLSESLLQSSQSTILSNSPFIILIRWLALRPLKKTLVSSANNMGYKIVDTLAISLIYNKNNNGPRIEPCGTPHVTVLFVDSIPRNTTHCARHDE